MFVVLPLYQSLKIHHIDFSMWEVHKWESVYKCTFSDWCDLGVFIKGVPQNYIIVCISKLMLKVCIKNIFVIQSMFICKTDRVHSQIQNTLHQSMCIHEIPCVRLFISRLRIEKVLTLSLSGLGYWQQDTGIWFFFSAPWFAKWGICGSGLVHLMNAPSDFDLGNLETVSDVGSFLYSTSYSSAVMQWSWVHCPLGRDYCFQGMLLQSRCLLCLQKRIDMIEGDFRQSKMLTSGPEVPLLKIVFFFFNWISHFIYSTCQWLNFSGYWYCKYSCIIIC